MNKNVSVNLRDVYKHCNSCEQLLNLESYGVYKTLNDIIYHNGYCLKCKDDKESKTKKEKNIKQQFLNIDLSRACENGNMGMIKLLISKGANDFNSGLSTACRMNRIDVINLMIECGANNFNSCLNSTCYKGHMNLIEFLIKKGANDWNSGLRGACQGGNLEIVKLMVNKGANDLNEGLELAYNHSYSLDIVKYLVEHGANAWMHDFIDPNNIKKREIKQYLDSLNV